MDVTCPACSARYTADEQKLRGKTARMRCRACDTVWLVSGPENKMNEAMPAARAAVVKRGAEREHRDLFATSGASYQSPDFGSVKETLRPPPPDSNIGVGARNETSVLFTMDALKGNARVKTPEPEPAPLSRSFQAVDDDEGVIDLKALASGPPKTGARHIAPLFSEPPPAAFAADVQDSGANGIVMPGGLKLGKRAFVGIAAAAVAVILCSIGLAAAFRGEEPSRSAASTMTVSAPTLPPPAAVAPATAPQPVAATSSSASSDDEEVKASGVKKKGRKAGAGKASFSATKVQSSGVSSKKSDQPLVSKTPQAADKCGCKGDFNCILRCTAKGK